MLALPAPKVSESEDIIADTAKKVLIDYSSRDVRKIEELVYNAVTAVLDEVAKVQPLFKVSELLKVGGFNEGTKILEPNEFDYLAVFEELSTPDAVSVDLHPRKDGIARLKLNERLNVDGKWDRCCSDGYIRCLQLDRQTSNDAKNRQFEIFGREIIKAVFSLNRDKGRRSFRQFTEMIFTDNPYEYHCNIYQLQQAMIRSAEAHFPNILLEFTIASKRVTVDICPAVRYHKVSDCFSPEKCFSLILAESVLQRGTILFVGQTGYDVKITFTETEMDYIKNKMLERHKLLYIYLKYVSSITEKYYWISFTSYALKTACIRHDIQCRRHNKSSSECLRNVLDSIHLAMVSEGLPSVFISNIDLFAKLSEFELKAMRGVIAYLKMIPPLALSATNVSKHEQDIRMLIKELADVYDPNAVGDLRTIYECEILYSRRQ